MRNLDRSGDRPQDLPALPASETRPTDGRKGAGMDMGQFLPTQPNPVIIAIGPKPSPSTAKHFHSRNGDKDSKQGHHHNDDQAARRPT